MPLIKHIISFLSYHRYITILFAIFCITLPFCLPRPAKIYQDGFTQLGVRYLDHLEFDVPEQSIPRATNQNPNPNYQSADYAPLVNSKYHAPVYLTFINKEVGYGVFAGEPLKKGQMIGEYTGILKQYDANKAYDCEYSWGYLRPAKHIIDAKTAGNFTRFINHSHNPNVDPIYVSDGTMWHLVYVANQDIPAHQQLLVHYGDCYWKHKPLKLKVLK